MAASAPHQHGCIHQHPPSALEHPHGASAYECCRPRHDYVAWQHSMLLTGATCQHLPDYYQHVQHYSLTMSLKHVYCKPPDLPDFIKTYRSPDGSP